MRHCQWNISSNASSVFCASAVQMFQRVGFLLQLEIDRQVSKIPHRIAEIAVLEIDCEQTVGIISAAASKHYVVAVEVIVAGHPRMALHFFPSIAYDAFDEAHIFWSHRVAFLHAFQMLFYNLHWVVPPHPIHCLSFMDPSKHVHSLRQTLPYHLRRQRLSLDELHDESPTLLMDSQHLGSKAMLGRPAGSQCFRPATGSNARRGLTAGSLTTKRR